MDNRYLEQIDYLLDIGRQVLATKKDYPPSEYFGASTFVDDDMYVSWKTDLLAYLQNNFSKAGVAYIESIQNEQAWSTNYTEAKAIQEILTGFRDKVHRKMIFPDSYVEEVDNESELKRIFDRFHDVVRELRTRHGRRETLSVKDEYDVQDLLRSLLRIYFNDVRKEEWTPSFAGASARMDFLLKKEQIVIEVKKTRESLTEKKLGDELIEDIARYKNHPDCKKLICFVYDPEGLLGNPAGIMNDLNAQNEGFAEVIIRPL